MQKTYEQLDESDQQAINWMVDQLSPSQSKDPIAVLGGKLSGYLIGTLISDDSGRKNIDVAREAICQHISEDELAKFKQTYLNDKFKVGSKDGPKY